MASDKWELVLNWCLMAAQPDSKGDSLVAFAVDAVTEGGDKYLGRWIEQRLDSTMRPRPFAPQGGKAPGVAGPNNLHQVSVMMATEVGKGVALGLRALEPLCLDTSAQGGTANTETKGYTKEDIASLMGFSGVDSGRNLQAIWDIFSASSRKNIDAYWRHISAQMKQWSFDRHIRIDTSIYLEQEMIKAIVELPINKQWGQG